MGDLINGAKTIIANQWDQFSRQSASSDHGSLSGLSQEDFMKQFDYENWQGLQPWQKIDIAQELENRQAAADGREPADVTRFFGSENNAGNYYGTSNQITLNNNILESPSKTYFSTMHEDNHAHQEKELQTRSEEGEDPFSRTMMKAEQARDAEGRTFNYIDYSDENEAEFYNTQFSEMDSNNAAVRSLLENEEYFANDPTYQQTVEELSGMYQSTNDTLDTEQVPRDMIQERQLENALDNQAITEDEYNDALSKINDPEGYENDLESETRDIGQELDARCYEMEARNSASDDSEETEYQAEEPEAESEEYHANRNEEPEEYQTDRNEEPEMDQPGREESKPSEEQESHVAPAELDVNTPSKEDRSISPAENDNEMDYDYGISM